MFGELNEECGIAGIVGSSQASYLVYLCLYALQHRGQEACGIASFEKESSGNLKINGKRSFGLVNDNFNETTLSPLKGDIALGHVRYSTSGGKLETNIQPFSFNTAIGPMAIAHNGNLTNAHILRKKLEEEGSIFRSSVDSEVFIHLLAKSVETNIVDRIATVMKKVEGAYSLVMLAKDSLIAIRDPFGFRPLVIGKLKNTDNDNFSYIAVSETCALDLIGAEFIREVEPGEIITLNADGKMESLKPFLNSPKPKRFCSFESIYFARPDSRIFGQEMYEARKNIGRVLAKESPVDCDAVIAVPDSGVPIANGFGEALGKPVEVGLVRNHYVGRTFIQPTQNVRDFNVRLKLNAVESVLKGKKIAVIDDSIVRGTTSVKIIRMLRAAGAKEIHMRIGSPPITHSCFYGVDTPERKDLLAAQKNIEQMRVMLEADSLSFLSLEGLQAALKSQDNLCLACFTGDYPEKVY